MDIAEQWVNDDSAKYAELSVKEKGRKVVEEMAPIDMGQIVKAAWALEIEKAIIAAIEAEREACAEIAEDAAKEWRHLSSLHLIERRDVQVSRRYAADATVAQGLADRIRARSTPKIAPHAFKGRTDRWCEVCNRPDRDPIHAGQNAPISEIDRKIENS